MDNLDIEAATWSLENMLFYRKPCDSFERKELLKNNFGIARWELLKAIPLEKIIEIGNVYHIKMNGCGPQSWRFDVVPDKPLWLLGVDFEDSGNAHDVLFAIGGSQIDFICSNLYFHYHTRKACRNHFPNAWRFGFRYGCVTSRLYYEAVAKFGWPHFVKR